jgi:hypothetical protein
MHQVEQKRLLIERIVPHLIAAPGDVVQRLLQKSVSDLETILEDAITKKTRTEAADRVTQHADEMRAASVSEGAWTHACRALINGKRLSSIQSNRDLLESLLNPGETPSAKLYVALAEQYPQRFAWSPTPTTQTDEERRANFVSICRQNNLSECDANAKLHQAGIGTEQWAGASQVELQEFRAEAALARQKWLVNTASPTELRAEARYESQAQLAANQQSQADVSLQAQNQRDAFVGYRPLPPHIDRKALIAATKDQLRQWSRLFGQYQLNVALRGQQ